MLQNCNQSDPRGQRPVLSSVLWVGIAHATGQADLTWNWLRLYYCADGRILTNTHVVDGADGKSDVEGWTHL